MTLLRSLVFGAAAAMAAGGAQAADETIIVDPVIDYASSSYFEGFYWGLYAGGSINLDNNLHVGRDVLGFWHDNRFNMGGAAGYNFLLTESVLAGIEIQVGTVFDLSGQVGAELLAQGRLGYTLMDNLLIYATVGAGYYLGTGVFTVGGGAELGISDGLALRAEIMGMGELGENNIPGHVEGIDGISATRFTFGALWHLN